MEIFHKKTKIDFIGTCKLPITVSIALVIGTIVILFTRGLNFGLDFTGGTVVELSYKDGVEISQVRKLLAEANIENAVVQHFGSTRDVLIRLPVSADKDGAKVSNRVIEVLRNQVPEHFTEKGQSQTQKCRDKDNKVADCQIQVRRAEFVGPQVGQELIDKGGLALIYTLLAISVYIIFRFQWRYAVAASTALIHDVLLTFGFFSLMQVEFDLSVLAAILAVLGYSLNDTIVVFDRVRENFRTMRKNDTIKILNTSLNQTLSRTVITSGTTLIVLLALLFLGGKIIHGFAIALIVGVFVGTYSSLYIATPTALALGVSREDLVLPKKELSGDGSQP